MLSKDEVSDLESYINRVEQTTLAQYQASLVQDEARRQLALFLAKLQQKPQ